MFSNLISTITITAILQSIVYIISPQSHIKNTLLVGSNIICVWAILGEIIELINKIF